MLKAGLPIDHRFARRIRDRHANGDPDFFGDQWKNGPAAILRIIAIAASSLARRQQHVERAVNATGRLFDIRQGFCDSGGRGRGELPMLMIRYSEANASKAACRRWR